MANVHVSVGRDQATFLTLFNKEPLEVDIQLERGKNVEWVKNRAIDQLWPRVGFCHAVAALASLRVFDAASGRELAESEAAEANSHIVLAQEFCHVDDKKDPPSGALEKEKA